jgi:hypothetical protein
LAAATPVAPHGRDVANAAVSENSHANGNPVPADVAHR